MAEGIPDDFWTSSGHRHKFKIDPKGDKVVEILKRQGTYWLQELSFDRRLALTCVAVDNCTMYVTIETEIFYPTMVKHV